MGDTIFGFNYLSETVTLCLLLIIQLVTGAMRSTPYTTESVSSRVVREGFVVSFALWI